MLDGLVGSRLESAKDLYGEKLGSMLYQKAFTRRSVLSRNDRYVFGSDIVLTLNRGPLNTSNISEEDRNAHVRTPCFLVSLNPTCLH